jgi:hypothetical protein
VRELAHDARAAADPGPTRRPQDRARLLHRVAALRPARPTCTARRHSIPHDRCYPAGDAARVHASAVPVDDPDPDPDAGPGSRSFLDFAVVADHTGPHSVAVTYDHCASTPLALGFALDRGQTRTVHYPPLRRGTTRRTLFVDVHMRRGPGVIRVAEGPTGARLHVHSLRVTGARAAPDAREGAAAAPPPSPPRAAGEPG